MADEQMLFLRRKKSSSYVRLDVFTAVTKKNAVSWDMR
jgi:hypothetical protein